MAGDLASRQRGVVARRQLLEAGLSADQIHHLRAGGHLRALQPPVRGVYAVGHGVVPELGVETAALLACGGDPWRVGAGGRDVLLGQESALALWCDEPSGFGAIAVTAVGLRASRRGSVRATRVTDLPDADRRRHRGLPVTSPARTILDVAPARSPRALGDAVDRLRVLRLVTEAELDEVLDSGAGRRGVVELRALLGEERGNGFSRSVAERQLLGLLRAAHLPIPARNVVVHGRERDLVWHASATVVEFDGRTFHDTPGAFERDRTRDAELAARGWTTVRVTARMLRSEPTALVARLAAVLALGESRRG